MALRIGLRQARRRAVAQAGPVVVEQQDGAEDPGQLGFDETNEMLEHILQRGAHRDHFEDLRLPVAQGVGELALGDVAGDAGHAEDFVALVAQRHLRRRYPRLAAGPRTYSSMSNIGCPDWTIRCSSAKNFCAISWGRSSRSRLADQVRGPRHADTVAVTLLAMTKRLSTSLTQRLSGSQSIRACSDRRSFGYGARGLEFGDVLMRRDPAAVGHRLVTDLNGPPVRELGGPGSCSRPMI